MSAEGLTFWDAPSHETVAGYYRGMRAFWHPVLPEADLSDGQPVGVELLGERIVVARLDGQVTALEDLCRHFQARLSLGEVVEHNGQQCLMCPYHGWAYDSSGRCVRIPQLLPGREIPRQARVPAYRTQTQHGLIWVCLSETPRYGIPEFPELDAPGFRAGPLRVYDPWEASAPRIIMGALDDTHFPWVHPGILADRSQTDSPDHRVWREGRYLVTQYMVTQPHNLSTANTTADAEGTASEEEITYTNYVGIPNTIRLVKDGRAGRYVIWLATLPHRYNLTTTFWRVARSYDRDPASDQKYEDFEDRVRAQDKPIVEGQRPWLIPPFWTRVEMPLRPADLPLIEYQRWLEELDISASV